MNPLIKILRLALDSLERLANLYQGLEKRLSAVERRTRSGKCHPCGEHRMSGQVEGEGQAKPVTGSV